MKKITVLLCSFMVVLASINAQPSKVLIYKPEADAKADISAAIVRAATQNKHILLQVGGNWCPWCVKLHKLFETDATIDSLLRADYIFVLVNYSKENKNLPLLKELDFPQRFGFPVLVVLDKTGKRIHTQDSSLLEEQDGYDTKKIVGFLKGWTVDAIDPKNY